MAPAGFVLGLIIGLPCGVVARKVVAQRRARRLALTVEVKSHDGPLREVLDSYQGEHVDHLAQQCFASKSLGDRDQLSGFLDGGQRRRISDGELVEEGGGQLLHPARGGEATVNACAPAHDASNLAAESPLHRGHIHARNVPGTVRVA
jgi:hypothetical protein